MSVMSVRGGIPYVLRDAAVPVAGRKIRLPFFVQYLQVRNVGSAVARLFFTAADLAAGENYVTVPVASATYPYGEWSGPVETHAGDHADLWLAGVGAVASIELVAYQRRG